MFPSEIDGLQELAHLSPYALLILADRFTRLAKLCRDRAAWITDRAHGTSLARAAMEHAQNELADMVRRMHRQGMGRAAVIAALPGHDERLIRHQYKLAARAHAEKSKGARQGAAPRPKKAG